MITRTSALLALSIGTLALGSLNSQTARLSFIGQAQAAEIAATPKMMADAKQMYKYENPNDDESLLAAEEYHFRNLGWTYSLVFAFARR